MGKCIFCNIVSGIYKASIFYEDELIMGFMDIEPINEGHILLITKAHKLDLDELNSNETERIMKISQIIVKILKETYKPNGYSIMQNGGEFNDIGHYHLHIFPRYNNDGFGWTFKETKENDLYALGKYFAEKVSEYSKATGN